VSLTEHLLSKYQLQIKALTLIPSRGGVFEVWVDNELVHSRRMTGQFPNEAEIDAALDERLRR
jgi:selenoprotein W-related protein